MSAGARVAALLLGLLQAASSTASDGEAELRKLAWLAGHWAETTEAMRIEEVWLAPDGDMMLGLHRDVLADDTFFEFLRIQVIGDVLHYVASPQGAPETAFPVRELEGCRVVFENLEHDFPTEIGYQRVGGELRVYAAGADDNGQQRRLSWAWWLRSGEVFPECE